MTAARKALGAPGWTFECAQRQGAQWWVAQGYRSDTPASLPLVTMGAETEEEAIQGLRELAASWDNQYGPVAS